MPGHSDALLGILVSFLVAMMKFSDKSKLLEKWLFLWHILSWWRNWGGKSLKQLVMLRPKSESREQWMDACQCLAPFSSLDIPRSPAQMTVLPTKQDGSSIPITVMKIIPHGHSQKPTSGSSPYVTTPQTDAIAPLLGMAFCLFWGS